MSRLDVFAAMVKSLEQGKPMPGFTDRTAAIQLLIEWVCFADWKTQEELDVVQSLIGRLCRMWDWQDTPQRR